MSDDRRHAWLAHGLRTPDQATIEHVELGQDEALREFLLARLRAEALAAVRRHAGREGSLETLHRQLEVLDDLVADLDAGRLPDDVTLDLLLTAYAEHESLRPEWRDPATLMAPAPSGRHRR